MTLLSPGGLPGHIPRLFAGVFFCPEPGQDLCPGIHLFLTPPGPRPIELLLLRDGELDKCQE